MRSLAALTFCALWLPVPVLAAPPDEGQVQTQTTDRLKNWSDGRDQVEALLRQREASDYADDWQTLHEDGGWFGKTTAERADAVIDILASSNLRGIRKQLHELRADIQDHRDKISESHFASVGRLDDQSRNAMERLIDAQTQAIQRDQSRIDELNVAFAKELHQAGIDLSQVQLSSLLEMTSGDDLSEIIELFASLRAISDALRHAVAASGEDIDTAKKYYEIYAVLLDTALYSETRFVRKIDELWLPRIDAVTMATRKLGAESDRLLATAAEASKPVLYANKKAQAMTLQTAELYRRYLLEQRHAAADAARKLMDQRNVALNTYKTVAQSIDLVRLIRTSGGAFQQLPQVEIPPLRPFESEQMKLEFDKLSGQIGKPGT